MNFGPAELAAGGGNDSWVGRGRGEARCVSAKPPPVRNVGVQCGALCSLYIFEGARCVAVSVLTASHKNRLLRDPRA